MGPLPPMPGPMPTPGTHPVLPAHQPWPTYQQPFSNPPTAEWEVNLAWATVQIHCFCTVNHNKVAILGDKTVGRKSSNPGASGGQQPTSFQPTAGEAGVCVLSTPAKILLCDMTLHPGEKCEFQFTETFPPSAPPTYR